MEESLKFTRTSAGTSSGDDGALWFNNATGITIGSAYKVTSIYVSFTHIRRYASSSITGNFPVYLYYSDGYISGYEYTATGFISGTIPGSGTTNGATISGTFNVPSGIQAEVARRKIIRVELGRVDEEYDIRCTADATCSATFYYDYNYTAVTKPSSVSVNTTVVTGSTTTIDITGAKPGTNNPINEYAYGYRDRAIGSSTWGNWSDTEGPTSLTITTIDASKPTVRATVNAPAIGYERQYRVRVSGTYGASDPTSSSNYCRRVSAPTAPTTVTLSPTRTTANTDVTLSWSGAAGATGNTITGYHIYRDNVYFDAVTSTQTFGSLSVKSHATAGSSYSFTVYTLGSAGVNSGASKSATLYSYGNPSAPTSVIAENAGIPTNPVTQYLLSGQEDAKVSWSGAKDGANSNTISGYQIFQNNDSSPTKTAAASATSVTIDKSTLTAGSSYRYRVKTLGQLSTASGYSSYSGYIYIYTKSTAPTQLTIDGSSVSPVYVKSGTTTLGWSGATVGQNNNISAYDIYKNDTRIDQLTIANDATSGSKSISTGDPGTESKFKVRTSSARGYSDYSPEITIRVYSDPSAPSSFTVQPATPDPLATVTISWSGQSNGSDYNKITKYQVYRDTNPNGSFSAYLGETTETTFEDRAPASPNSSYYYKVKSVGERSTSELSSKYATVTTSDITDCASPNYVYITPEYARASEKVTLQWDQAQGGTNNPIAGYLIEQNRSEYRRVSLTDIKGSLSDIDVNPTPGQNYSYRISTLGTVAGHDSKTPSAEVTVYTYSDPQAPSSFYCDTPISMPNTPVNLIWSSASGGYFNDIDHYEIYKYINDTDAEPFREARIDELSTQVNSPSAAALTDRYYIIAVGERSNSSKSQDVTVSTSAYTKVSDPEDVKVDKTLSNGEAATLSWSPSTDGIGGNRVTSYEIYYRSSSDKVSWGIWQSLQSVSASTLSIPVSPSDERGVYFQYAIKANGSMTTETANYDSNLVISLNTLRRNHDPLPAYQDLITPGTYVKAAHMNDLQDRLIFLLEFNNIDADPEFSVIVQKQTDLRDWSAHILQLRNAVDLITRDHEQWIPIPVNCPTAAVINQLRRIIALL